MSAHRSAHDQPLILDDLAASPTPYHAVARASELLAANGFARTEFGDDWSHHAGGQLLYASLGGALVAWRQPAATVPFVVAGTHTDSPNLRVRTQPDQAAPGFELLGFEVYGGVLLNSWLDRDLSLAGRVVARNPNSASAAGGATVEHLVDLAEPILRIPQLAIHLDRSIRENGLKVDPQLHTSALWAIGSGEPSPGALRTHIARHLEIDPNLILSWDLMTYDTQPPALVGRDGDMFASGRIDNLVSTFAAIRALIDVTADRSASEAITPVVVLYDHEEIGSSSATGAAGQLFVSTLERISAAAGVERHAHLANLTQSLVLSVDGAHATHPNYVDRHEPNHMITINGGLVIKRNANQRYATDAHSEAALVAMCQDADIPLQYYIHRNDIPCGSTIGPITAAQLGTPTVDLGIPQLAMHSAREMAGVTDLGYLQGALRAVWRGHYTAS